MSKWGSAYFPASYDAHKKDIAAALPKVDPPALTGELQVVLEFVCKPIAKSKFTTPMGDVDNLAKPILDVLTQQGWYEDDRQIVDLYITKRFAAPGETPHIKFKLHEQ
jgi:Holliday junction resolvase RusA-like endonuclease